MAGVSSYRRSARAPRGAGAGGGKEDSRAINPCMSSCSILSRLRMSIATTTNKGNGDDVHISMSHKG
eukprot:CAMPEP_0167805192 /NCGR_PEP_ID=MMETSP0111_2-20121227/21025_1 /TAXON_ID=91324 /ORGANISM="Lotharella globosa, Strain CCCM811" /LENGTH=66 /DNA_ID=CAMNT_0007702285 /DNA_START=84 /DNA_END=284 /DNA_ORIENTATION=-